MTLTQFAYLEVEGDGSTGTFELNIMLQPQSALDKSYLIGERGQYLREIINQTPGTGTFDAERRTGYWLDGGAGSWEITLQIGTGEEDVQWGDGSGGDGQGNVTTTDASGSGVAAISRLQVLQYFLAKTKSDSGGDTRLHWGEWTDGDIENVDSSGISAGAHDQPMPVAIINTQLNAPDPDQGDQASMEGTLTMQHVGLFGGVNSPDWAEDLIGAVQDAADEITDA